MSIVSLGAFFLPTVLFNNIAAQGIDTVQRLEEVTVSGQRTPSVLRTAVPTQVVAAEELKKLGSLQLSDAVKMMAGVTLKDYGGVGGIKTISARGLGSQFSAVTLDGIPVDDSQNGQVDLGRYLLGNAAYVSLSHGQEQGALLAARAYASGNVLNMETAEPQFFFNERTNLKVGTETGSFGLLSPMLQWEQRWSKNLKSSFFANYLKSDGNYPFTQYYSTSHGDSSSVEHRRHSAVWMLTADGNLFHRIGEGNTLTTKVHYMRGAHELPGYVAMYSTVESCQDSEEEMAFAQTRWRVKREDWGMQLLGKVRYGYDHYTDTTAGNNINDHYRQGEAYLSGSATKKLAEGLELDLAADGSLSRMVNSSLHRENIDVTRRNLCAVASLRYHTERLEARAHLLYTDVQDEVNSTDTTPGWRRATPFVSAMYKIGEATTLRAFYKQTYRVPKFSELYYFLLTPWDLKPERAQQVNVGVTQAWAEEESTMSGQLTLDAYYNRVNDKIVAKPSTNLYYWSMTNLGIVDILGLDATANLTFIAHHSTFNVQLNYSFHSAVDHTDEGSAAYGYQIVYTPRHSGGGSLRWENRWVNVGASTMVVGHRYSGAQNAYDNRLPAYCDVTLNADRKFDLRYGTLTLRASVLNALDTQYEVVISYPMMGRNWRVGVFWEF